MNQTIEAQILMILDLMGLTPEEFKDYVQKSKAAAKMRVIKKNLKFQANLALATDVQTLIADKLESEGAKFSGKIWRNRRSGNICMLYSQGTWDSAKGRIGRKLIMIYPDGSVSKTFEKSISIKSEF
jgi:hypothetical protein